MKNIACVEDEIQVVRGVERVEVSRTNVRNGRKSDDDSCHACYSTGTIRDSRVWPLEHLPTDQPGGQHNIVTISRGLSLTHMEIREGKTSDVLKRFLHRKDEL